jgi:XTP/dITP diphosphohydrolase
VSARIVLATRNAKKLDELRRIVAAAGLDAEIVGTEAFADLPETPETGATFAENAVLKAAAVAQHTGLVAVADDSGLCVDALGGMPGVLSARWAGGHGDDDANLDLVLAQLADMPDGRRDAHFACAAAVVAPGGDEHVVEGRVDGVLLHARRGVGGFGYDPIFLPEGHDLTTAEMTPQAKDAISHRGRALRALLPYVAEAIEGR